MKADVGVAFNMLKELLRDARGTLFLLDNVSDARVCEQSGGSI